MQTNTETNDCFAEKQPNIFMLIQNMCGSRTIKRSQTLKMGNMVHYFWEIDEFETILVLKQNFKFVGFKKMKCSLPLAVRFYQKKLGADAVQQDLIVLEAA